MQTEKHLTAYRALRKRIDTSLEKLSAQHAPHMKCSIGCDLCCMDYSILPVEFYAILDELKEKGIETESIEQANDQNGKSCVFLKNHSCTLYESRPVICRTHGHPLLFTNDDYEWELSTCELNFTDYDYENFTPDNTWPQDTYNSKLFMLNKKFVTSLKGETAYGEFDLIPLKNLAEKL
jgi:uncharacterized protein